MHSLQKGQSLTNATIFIFMFAFFILFANFSKSLELSFVAVIAVIVFIIAFVNTEFALIIFIFSILFSPELEAGGVTGRPVAIRADDILLFVIFFGWLAKMAINKELGFARATPLNTPMAVYIFICLVSTMIGIIQGYIDIKASFFFLLKYIEYFLLFFMVINNIKSIAQARRFIFLILTACFLVCLYAWIQLPGTERVSAPFEQGGEPNTFAGYLLLMMALILGLILNPEGKKKTFILLGLFIFCIIPFTFTLSRGGWLSFFPMLLTLILLTKRFKAVLIIFSVIMVASLPYILPQRIQERIKSTFAAEATYQVLGKRVAIAESAAARIDSWGVALKRLSSRPFLGYGVPTGSVVDNQFARVLGETGTFGFISFTWIVITLFKIGWSSYAKKQLDNFSRGVSLGFIAGLVAILFQSLSCASFIVIRIMEPFWFLAAIVVMLPQIAPEKAVSERND